MQGFNIYVSYKTVVFILCPQTICGTRFLSKCPCVLITFRLLVIGSI